MLAHRTTTWVAGASALAVLLLAASWFLLISPVRAQAADDRTQTTAATAHNALLRTELAQLRSDYVQLPAQQAELAKLRQEVPTSTDLAGLVRQLQAAADAAGVSLTSVAPGAAAAETAATPAATAATSSASTSTASASSASTSAAATAVAGATGLYEMPLTVTATGSFARIEVFVQQVQVDMARAFLVTTLDLGASDSSSSAGASGDLAVSLTGSVFVLPSASTASTASASASTAATSSTSTS